MEKYQKFISELQADLEILVHQEEMVFYFQDQFVIKLNYLINYYFSLQNLPVKNARLDLQASFQEKPEIDIIFYRSTRTSWTKRVARTSRRR